MLERTRQCLREDVDGYIKCFHKRALNCYDPVADMLVGVHGMIEDYQVHHESLQFASFSWLTGSWKED